MPTYDYRCRNCRQRVSLYLTYEEYDTVEVACPECGSRDLQRLIHRVRIARSEESRMESMADPGDWPDFDEGDPQSMARMMRKMGDELGEEMPPEFDEMVGRLEAGESPEEIEQNMPELGEGPDLDDF